MGRVQVLVDDVLQEGQFNVTSARALAALDSRHKRMVAESRCFRQTVSIGPTVADQANYDVPAGVVEILEVQVDGVTYGNARRDDIARYAGGYLTLCGVGGVDTRDDDDEGVEQIALIPAPSSAGSVVSIYAVMYPPDLDTADDTTLKIPAAFDEPLEAGAIARLMHRVEHRPDLAQSHEQEYLDGVERLRRLTVRKHRGPGPAQVRVVGYNV